MSKSLKVAVVGFWHVHAGDYARRAQQHPGTELVAVWDDDEARGRAGAAELGTAYTRDLESLLRRDDLDAVIITTSTNVHRDVMVNAAMHQKHIFTEKVLAPTVEAAEEIIEAADSTGVKLVVSLPRLYHGYTKAIVDLIASGGLGRVTYGRVRLSHGGAIPRDGSAGWLPERFFDPETAIGGALTDLGCHPAYLIQRFLGAEPATVSATYGSMTGRAVEDHAVVTVEYADQMIGVIEAGFVSDDPFTIELHGTDGRVMYADDGSGLRVAGPGFGSDRLQVVATPGDAPDPFSQWVDHIGQDTRADENLSRAVALSRLVVAANLAASSGRTVQYTST